MVIMGATASRLAMIMPISDMASVSSKARLGSPSPEQIEKKRKNGMIPSAEMACRRRGALKG